MQEVPLFCDKLTRLLHVCRCEGPYKGKQTQQPYTSQHIKHLLTLTCPLPPDEGQPVLQIIRQRRQRRIRHVQRLGEPVGPQDQVRNRNRNPSQTRPMGGGGGEQAPVVDSCFFFSALFFTSRLQFIRARQLFVCAPSPVYVSQSVVLHVSHTCHRRSARFCLHAAALRSDWLRQ